MTNSHQYSRILRKMGKKGRWGNYSRFETYKRDRFRFGRKGGMFIPGLHIYRY